MEKMFDRMMQDFCSGMFQGDSHNMKECLEKMAAMCPCGNKKDLEGYDRKAMMEKMTSFCGRVMMEMMSGAGKTADVSK